MGLLKKWDHFDGFDRQSFDGISDVLLHSLVWSDWDGSGMESTTTSSNSAEPVIPASSDDVDDGHDDSHSSKRRKVEGRKKQNARSGDKYEIGAGSSIARRHDLRDIAERGGGGRVMFMLEKASKSKMLTGASVASPSLS